MGWAPAAGLELPWLVALRVEASVSLCRQGPEPVIPGWDSQLPVRNPSCTD